MKKTDNKGAVGSRQQAQTVVHSLFDMTGSRQQVQIIVSSLLNRQVADSSRPLMVVVRHLLIADSRILMLGNSLSHLWTQKREP